MDFEKDTYSQETFSKLVLAEETIESKVFDECEFTDCLFIGCKLEKCRLLNCKFDKCDLSNIIPMNSEFREVKFTNCKTIGIDWTRAGKIKELNFSECLINYSNFRLLKLPKTVIKKCEVKEVDFIETDLKDSNLASSDFENSVFFKTNLSGVNFSHATNYTIDVNNNTLKKTRFSLPEALSLLSNLDIIVE
ncbi:MAG: pentapeptide repeat-containing protein [Dehalococcoidales bacterium]|nr:pentapeptide repeat-containing protein [Dehalococcoidales bacterium]